MSNVFTKRNHYNPCFWTALWNENYYRQYCSGQPTKNSCRGQVVYALNLRSGKIYPTTVERVHYQSDLGIAEIQPESMKRFCARWHPTRYKEMSEYVAANPESLYLDFEDILSGMERMDSYASLMEAAKRGNLTSTEQKGFLICHLMLHAMRSYEFMSGSIEWMNSRGMDKWEYFWLLKHTWSDGAFLARAVTIPAFGEWTLWRTSEHVFPLCDSPVLIDQNSLMTVLSPRLLLEINVNVRSSEGHWVVRDEIPKHKLAEFRRRSIANSFREILFSDSATLQDWLTSRHAQERIAALGEPAQKKRCIRTAMERVLFGVNGFGRLAEDFEAWFNANSY